MSTQVIKFATSSEVHSEEARRALKDAQRARRLMALRAEADEEDFDTSGPVRISGFRL